MGVNDDVLRTGPSRPLDRGKACIGRDHVAGTQCRIGRHLDAGEPIRILAVAAAVGDQFLAIEEGILEVGVARAVAGNGVLDGAAGKGLGAGPPDRTPGTTARGLAPA